MSSEEDYYDLLTREINDLSSSHFEFAPPTCQVISGSGYGWYLDAADKRMVRVPRGAQVTVIEEKPDKKGKILVRTDYRYLWIHEKEVIELGYN
jgi:hypothetical protein